MNVEVLVMTSWIPIIDFSDYSILKASLNQKSKVGEEIFEAFRTAGFVYLKNTGISKEAVDKVNDVTRIFFEASTVKKEEYARKQNSVDGYTGLNVEKPNPNRPADYKEAFNIYGGSILNPTTWPTDISPDIYNVVKPFMENCKQLTLNIFEALAIGMKLKDQDFFKKGHSLMNKTGNLTLLRTLYYPPIKHELKPGQVRLGEHSDFGTMTLLFQDQVGGLQIENLEGQYIDATPIEDTVLVNIGDALQFWSNNKLKARKHRILAPDTNKRNVIRRSIGYFANANDDVVVNLPLEYKNERVQINPDLKPITGKEYVFGRASKVY